MTDAEINKKHFLRIIPYCAHQRVSSDFFGSYKQKQEQKTHVCTAVPL